MSFDRPRHGMASVDKPVPSNQRAVFLEVLGQALQGARGVDTGLVMRDGRQVLFVVSSVPFLKRAEISCDFNVRDGWWYSWVEKDPRTIGPVEDTDGTVEAVVSYLRDPKAL